MNITLRATGTLLALGLFTACDKDKAGPDICEGQKIPKLTMRFLEQTGTPTPDTAFTGQTITFEAPGPPYNAYEWQVGSTANTRTTRSFSLSFGNDVTGQIPVRLIAKRRADPAGCPLLDDGVDTLTRVLTLIPPGDLRAPIYGKFQGANRHAPLDTFTVRVFLGGNYIYPNNPAAPRLNYLYNLSKGCRSPSFTVGLRWNGISFSYGRNDFGCLTPLGKGYLTTRDSIRIEYNEDTAPGNPVRRDKVFLGRRIR
ncbi:hypothetical protein [Hymenobacter yonginensis]|uniref:Lipoprotein n=1 Tax=Hymenobacter yonginensis TaxID=748197 RepID=A0ABY7PQC9_9BACT|nr:hypothetical protein [Hymenobacter yonginensis]WBO84922.1 hypothetical protein O9Z63_01455 [Hymenobacter yonginensis]